MSAPLEWATKPLRVSVVPEGTGVWVEFETSSFVTRYLLPRAAVDWLTFKLASVEAGSREVTGDDWRTWTPDR